MAKIVSWILVAALFISMFGKDNVDEGYQLSFLVLLCVLTIAEAIEKIGK